MKLLKKALAVLLFFIIISSITLWALVKSIKPETIKNYVSAELKLLTNQNTKIEGDISWQVFPRPAIKITKMIIGEENGPDNFAFFVDSLHFNLKITPLFRGKLIFSELNVDGFKIKLNAKASQFFTPKNILSANQMPVQNDQFAIERFLLSHGEIIFDKDQKTIKLHGLQVGAEHFNFERKLFPVQLKGSFELEENKNKIFKTHLNFKGILSLPVLFTRQNNLSNIFTDGQLVLQNAKFNQIKIGKMAAHFKAKAGSVFLNPLTFSLYNGESVGDLQYEFLTKKLTINQTATNINGAKLVKDLFKRNILKGNIDFSIHTQANLQKINWQETLQSQGNLTIKEGIIESFNLNKIIDEVINKLNQFTLNSELNFNQRLANLGQFNNPDFFQGSSAFQLFTVQYNLHQGVLEGSSLVLQTDTLQLKGAGNLNLKDQKIESHFFAVVNRPEGEAYKIQQLLGGGFPILVKGTIFEPIVSPDVPKISPVLTKLIMNEAMLNPVKKVQETLKTMLPK